MKKKRQYITLMIVKGNGEKSKTIRFPKLMVNVFLGLILTFVVYTSFITYATANLSSSYQAKLEDINTLEETNNSQKLEISRLNMITAEVREKLKSLEELEAKIKKLVGIKD
ncbi:MAG: hypothetical protein HPY66_0677 [Firmicutes bacterium]|nr:hypothetical protein [Bacillota bacterium]